MRSLAIVSPVSYDIPKALMFPDASIVAGDAAAPWLAPSLAPWLAPALDGAVLSPPPLLAAGALPAADDGAAEEPWPLLHAVTSNESAMRAAPPERRVCMWSSKDGPVVRPIPASRAGPDVRLPARAWSGCPVRRQRRSVRPVWRRRLSGRPGQCVPEHCERLASGKPVTGFPEAAEGSA